MKRYDVCFAFALLMVGGSIGAQTVTTSGGATNSIPVFTGQTTLGSSVISISNDGYLVGIGQPNATAPLNVSGNLFIGPLNYHGDASLHIYTPQGCCGYLTKMDGGWQNGITRNIMSSSDSSGVSDYWSWGLLNNQWSVSPGIWSNGPTFTVTDAGYVGIGTTTPGGGLEVHGGTFLLSAPNATFTMPDVTVQTTAWNGTTQGGDYAESIDVVGDRAQYEPGDVITIDATSPGRFTKADKAYSRLIAGVYSTKPGLVGRRTTFERVDKSQEVPMAMLGIAPVKVTTENGPIEPGDLLVSGTKPGFAMKGTDQHLLKGAVLGKALEPLQSGSGVIEALISIP